MHVPKIKQIKIKQLVCFQPDSIIDCTIDGTNPARWVIILGDNGTGKTSLLREVARSVGGFHDSWGTSAFEVQTESVHGWSPDDWENTCFLAYGASRQIAPIQNTNTNRTNTSSLLEGTDLENPAELLVNLEFLRKIENPYNAEKEPEKHRAEQKKIENAAKKLVCAKNALCQILPDVHDVSFAIADKSFRPQVVAHTDYGKVPLSSLSHGYQTMSALLMDIVARFFDAYPESENPLQEEALIFIDEIDLHLHPKWQQQIVEKMDQLFPHAQFIVTTHSPLVVQSAAHCNVVQLRKEQDRVTVTTQQNVNYRGWRAEEILLDLMGVEDTRTQEYRALMDQFDAAVDAEDAESAKETLQKLQMILHPRGVELKRLQIDLAGIPPKTGAAKREKGEDA